VETLASHYYSSIGIGGLAPLQSLLLNNMPPAPQHLSSIHPSVLARNYSSPSGIPRPNQGYNINPSASSPPGYMSKQMRFDYFSKLQNSPYSRGPSEPMDFRFGNKSHHKMSESPSEGDQSLSDLANLESRFGHNSSILSQNNKFQDAINLHDDARSSTSSDIDCEEIEN
jgi:hypothetical protein